jgi:hypothetical protein
VIGLEDIPADERPPANTLLHLSFDAMVGIGTALLALAGWLGFIWWRRRDIPRTLWFLRAVAVSGVGAIVALWCGWIVTEVGRQPWIVQGYMRTSEAVTEAEGIWFAFAGVLVLYAGLGVGAVLVLRAMSRRWREEGEGDEAEAPYGPRCAKRGRSDEPSGCRRGDSLDRGDALRGLRRGRLRRRLWDLLAGCAERGERPRARIQRSLDPVWEANHVWLIFILVVLWTAFPRPSARSCRRSTCRSPWPPSASSCAVPASPSASRSAARVPARDGRRLRPLLGADPVLHGDRGGRDRRRQRSRRRQRRCLLELDRAAAAADRRPLRRQRRLPGGDLPRRRLPRAGDGRWRATSPAAPWPPASSPAPRPSGSSLHADARYVYDRLLVEGCRWSSSPSSAGSASWLLLLRGSRGAAPARAGAVVAVIWGWGVAQFPYLLPTSLKIGQAAAPDPTLDAVLIVFVVAAVVVLPSLGLLYWLSQRELLGSRLAAAPLLTLEQMTDQPRVEGSPAIDEGAWIYLIAPDPNAGGPLWESVVRTCEEGGWPAVSRPRLAPIAPPIQGISSRAFVTRSDTRTASSRCWRMRRRRRMRSWPWPTAIAVR